MAECRAAPSKETCTPEDLAQLWREAGCSEIANLKLFVENPHQYSSFTKDARQGCISFLESLAKPKP